MLVPIEAPPYLQASWTLC